MDDSFDCGYASILPLRSFMHFRTSQSPAGNRLLVPTDIAYRRRFFTVKHTVPAKSSPKAGGRPAEGSDAVQSQISVDGRGKTTLRSSQQAIQSQPCRPSGLKHKPLIALAIL